MSRPRKQRTPDLKALEHIPAVREALRYVGLELLIRPLGHVVAPPLTQKQVDKAAEQPIQILHPADARKAWLEQNNDAPDPIAQALAAEKSRANPPKPISQLPAGQRRALEQGFLLDVSGKAEKLAQFEGRNGTNADAGIAVAVEPIETLSEVT